ncbi:uncharacterized protein SCHCODRAFT_02333238 [Schizophyllum commune H4-8]|uniref:uncharacterized protein n=1 Tax=Schizophyllum commune (strain H4-8 / FGSC 9210) TaxID=578458 RepID=UPI00215EBCB7|nr:uncharacterized protein SCHCODRAFT_02333238 [Schizophyllum commune H4-8]KAI5889959.1 hypothetical protein SCHCODRAFT_02333238 [Schizophyllum commune H4-8]
MHRAQRWRDPSRLRSLVRFAVVLMIPNHTWSSACAAVRVGRCVFSNLVRDRSLHSCTLLSFRDESISYLRTAVLQAFDTRRIPLATNIRRQSSTVELNGARGRQAVELTMLYAAVLDYTRSLGIQCRSFTSGFQP